MTICWPVVELRLPWPKEEHEDYRLTGLVEYAPTVNKEERPNHRLTGLVEYSPTVNVQYLKDKAW